LREARLARVAQESKARPGDIVDVTEYLKPGPEEIFGLLPPRLGRWGLAHVRRDRAWPLKVTTTRLSGFLRLKALASLRRWRPRMSPTPCCRRASPPARTPRAKPSARPSPPSPARQQAARWPRSRRGSRQSTFSTAYCLLPIGKHFEPRGSSPRGFGKERE